MSVEAGPSKEAIKYEMTGDPDTGVTLPPNKQELGSLAMKNLDNILPIGQEGDDRFSPAEGYCGD